MVSNKLIESNDILLSAIYCLSLSRPLVWSIGIHKSPAFLIIIPP